MKRISSIDIARGIAIILMIEAHIPIKFAIFDEAKLGLLAAPFFLIISGISYEFFLHSRSGYSTSKRDLILESLSRSTILYLISISGLFLGSIFIPHIYHFQFLGWSLIQVIAFGYLLGISLPNGMKFNTIYIFIIFAITYLINNFFLDSFSFLVTSGSIQLPWGSTALLPWLAYFIFGRIMSNLYLNPALKLKPGSLLFTLLPLLLLLIMMHYLQYPLTTNSRNTFFIFLLICSAQLLISSLLILFIDNGKSSSIIFHIFERLGKIAFTTYYIHVPIIYILLGLLTYFIPSIKSFILHIICLIIVVSFLVIFEGNWRKYNYLFGCEWILRKGTQLLKRSADKILL